MLPTKILYNSCIAHSGFPIFELGVWHLYLLHTIISLFYFPLEVKIEMHYSQDMPKKAKYRKISRVKECSDFFFLLTAYLHAEISSLKQNDNQYLQYIPT